MIQMLMATMLHLSSDCATARLRETDLKNKCETATKSGAGQTEACRDAARAELARKTACQ